MTELSLLPPFHRAHAWTPLFVLPSSHMPSVTHIHSICFRTRKCHAWLQWLHLRIAPVPVCTGPGKRYLLVGAPGLLESGQATALSEEEGSNGSVNFQLTPRLEAHGIILCCSEALSASVDVVSSSFLTRRGPELDLNMSLETPVGALQLPLPQWKSSQGGPEDKTPWGFGVQRPMAPSPTWPPTGPWIPPPPGCSTSPPLLFKGATA